MSFASDVKEEIALINRPVPQKRAQLAALIQLLASLEITNGKLNLVIKCTNEAVVKRIIADTKTLYGVRIEMGNLKRSNLNKNLIFVLRISDKVKEILNDLDLWTDKGLQSHPHLAILDNDDKIWAYIAGCFMATGSVNSPETSRYHFEIRANEEKHCQFLVRLFEKLNFSVKTTVRREKYIVYCKKSEMINDILFMMGAGEAGQVFANEVISRDFYSNLQRINNIDVANEQKSMKVAYQQYETVKYLYERDLLHYLSDKDEAIAMMRYRHPDASLQELADLYEEETGIELSKSGIRHRFEKIIALADK